MHIGIIGLGAPGCGSRVTIAVAALRNDRVGHTVTKAD